MRNIHVQKAVDILLKYVDKLAEGVSIGAPPRRQLKELYDKHIEGHGGSVILACAFLAVYSLTDIEWDFDSVPTGTRGKYGDKRLAAELSFRHVTLHKNITAFGENLGWKGNVRSFRLSSDSRFSNFLSSLEKLEIEDRESLVRHIAWRFYESRVVPRALPKLPSNYLSYARSLYLCQKLIGIPSEGHIQQFLVAAFLEIHRRRLGNRIVTHHPHASDKFDGTAGDIEEFRGNELVAAYEVTVRDDWKSRLTDFASKVDSARLTKYIVFASNVRSDHDLFPASHLVDFVARLHFDIAIVDLSDFFSVFCAELQRDEIEQVINRCHELLCEPRLCGRTDIIEKFRDATEQWLDNS